MTRRADIFILKIIKYIY